jgi:hypothetical protein
MCPFDAHRFFGKQPFHLWNLYFICGSPGGLTHDTRRRRLYWLAVVTEGDELVVKPDAGIQPEMTGHQDILVFDQDAIPIVAANAIFITTKSKNVVLLISIVELTARFVDHVHAPSSATFPSSAQRPRLLGDSESGLIYWCKISAILLSVELTLLVPRPECNRRMPSRLFLAIRPRKTADSCCCSGPKRTGPLYPFRPKALS